MADTYTTNLNLTKPEPGAAEDTWGISLNSDLDTLDAIFSSSGTQVNLNPNQVNFADNKKAIFGTGGDLEIYHEAGVGSWIKEVGAGDLNIQAHDNLRLQNTASENYLKADSDGAVTIYYDNAAKLATTSTGIDVTGTVTSDGLTVEGDATIKGGSDVSNTGATLQLESTETQAAGSGASISFKGDDGSGTQRVFGVIKGSKTSANSGAFNGGLDFFTRVTAEANARKRLAIASNGDIAFYDSTGASQNMVWDASDDRLNFKDGSKSTFGTGNDLQIYHIADGNSLIANYTNTLIVRNLSDDQDVVIQTDNGSGSTTDYFRADGSTGEAKLYNYGNLKLKTTNTGIDVTGTVTSDGLIVNSGTTDTVATFQSSDQFADIKLQDSGGSSFIRQSNGSLIFEADRDNAVSSSALIFKIDGSNVGRFTSAGNLGIGTTAPTSPLTVKSSSTGSQDAGFTLQANGSTNAIFKVGEKSNGKARLHMFDGTTEKIAFYADGTANHISAGNLGIGTSSPSSKFHVKLGGIGDDSISLVESQGSSTYGVYIRSAYAEEMGRVGALSQADGGLDGASIAFRDYGRDIVFNTHEGASNSEKVRIKKDGKVGIGISSPLYPLDVQSASNIQLRVASTTASNNARVTYAPNNTNKFSVGVDASSSAFTFYDIVNGASQL